MLCAARQFGWVGHGFDGMETRVRWVLAGGSMACGFGMMLLILWGLVGPKSHFLFFDIFAVVDIVWIFGLGQWLVGAGFKTALMGLRSGFVGGSLMLRFGFWIE